MSARLPVYSCQKRLAVIWIAGFMTTLGLLVAQTLRQVYGGQPERVWSWFVPTVIPTLSLILGAVVQEARKSEENATVDGFAYRISAGLSAGYLGLVLLTVLMQPLTTWTPLELMSISNYWLGPVQGLVGISLGAFFVSREGTKA